MKNTSKIDELNTIQLIHRRDFYRKMFRKWLANFIDIITSVKVWGLVGGTWVSTYLAINDIIKGGAWVTFNTTIWALIFGMKEVFKIAKERDRTELSMAETQAEIEKDRELRNNPLVQSQAANFMQFGKEIVGHNPS